MYVCGVKVSGLMWRVTRCGCLYGSERRVEVCGGLIIIEKKMIIAC